MSVTLVIPTMNGTPFTEFTADANSVHNMIPLNPILNFLIPSLYSTSFTGIINSSPSKFISSHSIIPIFPLLFSPILHIALLIQGYSSNQVPAYFTPKTKSRFIATPDRAIQSIPLNFICYFSPSMFTLNIN